MVIKRPSAQLQVKATLQIQLLRYNRQIFHPSPLDTLAEQSFTWCRITFSPERDFYPCHRRILFRLFQPLLHHSPQNALDVLLILMSWSLPKLEPGRVMEYF